MARDRSRNRTFRFVTTACCNPSLLAAAQVAHTTEAAMPTDPSTRPVGIALTVGQSYTLELPGYNSCSATGATVPAGTRNERRAAPMRPGSCPAGVARMGSLAG